MSQGMQKIVKGREMATMLKYLMDHFKDFPTPERQNILPKQYGQQTQG